MNLLINVFVLLCSTSNYPVLCEYEFKQCVEEVYEGPHVSELSEEKRQSITFQRCYDGELFGRYFQ